MEYNKLIHLNLNQVSDFVRAASNCNFDVDIANKERRNYIVDAKSILGVLGLDLRGPLLVSYNGHDQRFENFLNRCLCITAA
jgi:phosphocarrier protein HPr